MFRNTVRADQASQSPAAGLSGIDRVLATLKEVARHPQGLRLEDLAKRLETPKSTIHRALAALRRAGFVDHDVGGSYRLGLEFMRVAFDHYEGLDDRSLIEPALLALRERFKETASYAKLVGAEVVYVAIIFPSGGIKLTATVGGRNPAHCTAVGKTLLAHVLPDQAAVEAYVAEYGPLLRRTPYTLTTAKALHRELAETRRRGYAVDREESESGVNCVALAVHLGPAGPPIGAISVSGLTHRTPMASLEKQVDDVRAIVLRHLGAGSLGR